MDDEDEDLLVLNNDDVGLFHRVTCEMGVSPTDAFRVAMRLLAETLCLPDEERVLH